MNDFKYVFGPIPSRRLGRSLGISPLPKKTCNYSCIYCQLGRTDKMTNKRQEFYKTEDIIAEFKQYLKDSDKFDIVTVVGEGEPTLAANLGELVVALKALTDKPVAVITNGALLSDPQVREELCHADMVLPSLDAYNQEISKKIDRPYGTIKFEEEFEGLKKFTHMYEGELWLEIMLVDGINDDEQSILKFRELLKELKYDRLYLNTPVRPPAEADVNVVSEERMRYAVETLGGISIEMMSSGAFFSEIEDDYEAVKSIIGRHPMNQFEVRGFLESRDVKDPEAMMEQMKQTVEESAKPENLPVQEHHHTYTFDIKSSKTVLVMFVMAVMIVLLTGFIYQVSVSNQQLAANDLKYRYVKMCGGIGEKKLTELETVFRDEQHKAIRDTVQNQVERYETRVRIRAEQLEQASIKERKAQKLFDDVKRLGEE